MDQHNETTSEETKAEETLRQQLRGQPTNVAAILDSILKNLSAPASITALNIFICTQLDDHSLVSICSKIIQSKQIPQLAELSDEAKTKMLDTITSFGEKKLHDQLPFQLFSSRMLAIAQIKAQLAPPAPLAALLSSFSALWRSSSSNANHGSSSSVTTEKQPDATMSQTTESTATAAVPSSSSAFSLQPSTFTDDQQQLIDDFSHIALNTLMAAAQSKPLTYHTINQAIVEISQRPLAQKATLFNSYLELIEDQFSATVDRTESTCQAVPILAVVLEALIKNRDLNLMFTAKSQQITKAQLCITQYGGMNSIDRYIDRNGIKPSPIAQLLSLESMDVNARTNNAECDTNTVEGKLATSMPANVGHSAGAAATSSTATTSSSTTSIPNNSQ